MNRKAVIKLAKQELKDKRARLINELDKLYKKQDPSCSEEINDKISEIQQIDLDLEKKGKKSNRLTWVDSGYKPAGRGNSASKAEISCQNEYMEFKSSRKSFDNGPKSLWLKAGVLVKTKDRDVPGIVISLEMDQYAVVLFGGLETHVRKLALRPAEWED